MTSRLGITLRSLRVLCERDDLLVNEGTQIGFRSVWADLRRHLGEIPHERMVEIDSSILFLLNATDDDIWIEIRLSSSDSPVSGDPRQPLYYNIELIRFALHCKSAKEAVLMKLRFG